MQSLNMSCIDDPLLNEVFQIDKGSSQCLRRVKEIYADNPTFFNLLSRIWEAIKGVFGCSHWKIGQNYLKDRLFQVLPKEKEGAFYSIHRLSGSQMAKLTDFLLRIFVCHEKFSRDLPKDVWELSVQEIAVTRIYEKWTEPLSVLQIMVVKTQQALDHFLDLVDENQLYQLKQLMGEKEPCNFNVWERYRTLSQYPSPQEVQKFYDYFKSLPIRYSSVLKHSQQPIPN